MWQVQGKRYRHKDIWWGSLKKTDSLKDQRVDGSVILKNILRNMMA
jgi:hypothetical protein